MAAPLPSKEDWFDWEGDRPLNIPLDQLIIYEMHVRGFTRHPSANVTAPGATLPLVCIKSVHTAHADMLCCKPLLYCPHVVVCLGCLEQWDAGSAILCNVCDSVGPASICDNSAYQMPAGTYLGLVEKLDYLQALGINAIELLPVQEFNELEYYQVQPLATNISHS